MEDLHHKSGSFVICEQILTLLRSLSFTYLELALQIEVLALFHVELKSTIKKLGITVYLCM